MAFNVTSWNIDPNREWYVRLSDEGGTIHAELYLTQADAEAQTNLQAEGDATAYGTNMAITLTEDPSATVEISLYQSYNTWHLRADGSAADPTKIFRVKQFVDLPEIIHPVYHDAVLMLSRATAEIDAHTHAKVPVVVELGTHLPTLEPGDILQCSSLRRGYATDMQVLEHQIIGALGSDGQASVTSVVTIAKYVALKR